MSWVSSPVPTVKSTFLFISVVSKDTQKGGSGRADALEAERVEDTMAPCSLCVCVLPGR